MGSKHYNQTQKESITNLYNQGLDTVQISKQLDLSQTGIERFLKKSNLYVKKTYRHKIPHSENENIKNMYLVDNKTTIQIANHYGVKDTAILKLLNRMGINTSNTEKYSAAKNLTSFENIDTELKAYLLGFILADGNITIPSNKDSMVFQLEIQERDNQVLYWLADLLKLSYQYIYTYKRTNSNRQPTSKISIYSKTLCMSLSKYSIIPRKSHTCTLPAIDIALQRHMIRGLIDADGHSSKYKLELYGNQNITNHIADIWNQQSIPIEAIRKYETTCYRVGIYQKQYRQLIGRWLYEDCNFYLARKARFYRKVDEQLPREFRESPEKGNPEPS